MSEQPQVPFQVKAIFDYKSDFEDDLNFSIGQIITVTTIENDEWFTGEYDGKSGMFPKNFVEIVPIPVVPTSNRPTRRTSTTEESSIAKQEAAAPAQEPEQEPTSPIQRRSSTKSIESNPLNVPMPQAFPHKQADPYSIKKQFVAAGTSHYIPKIQPRDESNVVHAIHEVRHSDDIVRSNDAGHEQEEEEGPKLTLKERIALLQKKQQEEAEREAAAAKKKEEKKKKQADEKERVKHLREQQQVASEEGNEQENFVTAVSRHGTGEFQPSDQSEISQRRQSLAHSIAASEKFTEALSENEEETEDAVEAPEAAHEGNEGDNEEEEAEDEQEEEEDEDEEEDDEETKRRKLIERMAKMSGGRNMFGMMGMPMPFGAPAAAPQPASKPKKKQSPPEPPVEEPRIEAHHAPPVPTADVPSTSPQSTGKFRQEGSSMAEDDEPSDTDVNELITQKEIDKQATQKYEVVSDSGIDEPKPLKLHKHTSVEQEGAGYEADEDLSDITKPPEVDHSSRPPPAVSMRSGESTDIEDKKQSHDTLAEEEEEDEESTPQETRAPPPPPPGIPEAVPPPLPSAPPSIPTEAPPVPGQMPPIPVRSYQEPQQQQPDSSDESSDEEDESPQPIRSHTISSFPPPPPVPAPISPTSAPPPIPMGNPPKRASTDLDHFTRPPAVGMFPGSRTSIDSRSSRSRTIEYRDYYILFYDLSQLVLELEFENQDPRNSIHIVNYFVKGVPIVRKDLLDRYHKQFSGLILEKAQRLIGSGGGTRIDGGIVEHVFEELNSTKVIVPAIGNKGYGVTIYKNINNSNVNKVDEIRSGDILWIKNGKFNVHKGIVGAKSVTVGGGGGAPYSAIIYEYDPKKEKFKVFETDSSGQLKKESYKLGEFKSGRIRVFRPVGRDYVDW
ncbi:uncharacterized protein J8A68_004109 [[Candida] subhashii]|uniref:SH3 domain-containing protein n=1 Tax=[Candida] subhashii TaxID=561895 RepID=A0A8J5QHS6_9ASCO|nr:uncharacterized protein J8A68_004109 [[Candida] subhashii]KAG7662338.1 hypothetical protein J8A68_004109 [[Candida] subhashii]